MPRKPKNIETDEYTKLVYEQMNRNDILREYRKVAKRLNQRLVTLEKQGYQMPQGEAKKFLESQNKRGFQERLNKYSENKTDAQLRKELLIMHRFEESKQSTISGRKETAKKIRETMLRKVMTDKQETEYDKLKSSRKRKDKQKADKMLEMIPEELMNEVLTSINDLKDKMSWEYEKAVNMVLEQLKKEPKMSLNKLKLIIQTATTTRNEVHFKKMMNNPSLTDYDSFSQAFTKVFGNFRVRH